MSCTEQNQTEVKDVHQNQPWQTLTIIFALLTGVLLIVLIGECFLLLLLLLILRHLTVEIYIFYIGTELAGR